MDKEIENRMKELLKNILENVEVASETLEDTSVSNNEEAAGNLVDALLLLEDIDDSTADIAESVEVLKELIGPTFEYLRDQTEYKEKKCCKDPTMDEFIKGFTKGAEKGCEEKKCSLKRDALISALVYLITSTDTPCTLLKELAELIIKFGENNDVNKEAYNRVKESM